MLTQLLLASMKSLILIFECCKLKLFFYPHFTFFMLFFFAYLKKSKLISAQPDIEHNLGAGLKKRNAERNLDKYFLEIFQ